MSAITRDDLISLSSDLSLDPIRAFIEECCDVKPGNKVDVHVLYDIYKSWCKSSGVSRPMIRSRFLSLFLSMVEPACLMNFPLSDSVEITIMNVGIKAGRAEPAATALARVLFQQIEAENPQCAFWVISALAKLRYDKQTLSCVFSIACQEMPQAAKDYAKYTRTT